MEDKSEKRHKRCSEPSCTRANELLPIEDFYKFQGGKDERRAICKNCYHKRYGKKEKMASIRRNYFMKVSPNTLTEEQKRKVLYDFDNKCALTNDCEIQLDHFIPLSWGRITQKYGIGGTTEANLIPLSAKINKSKSYHNPFTWIKEASGRLSLDMQKWNELVKYIAQKHKMSPTDFEKTVNECHAHITCYREINRFNRILKESRMHPRNLDTYLSYLLKLGINLKVAVEMFGNKKAKDFR